MKFIIPVTRDQLLTPADREFLGRLGIQETWMLEYVLSMWFAIVADEEDRLFEQVIDDLHGDHFRYDDTQEDNERQRFFAQHSDQFLVMVRRIYAGYATYLRDTPEAMDKTRPVINVGLKHENRGARFSVIELTFQDQHPDLEPQDIPAPTVK